MGMGKPVITEVNTESLFDFDAFKGNKIEPEIKTESKTSEKIISEHLEPEKKDPATETPQTAEQITEDMKKGFSNLNPKMVIDMFDIVMARTMSALSNLAGYPTSYKDYKLDELEKKQLTPFVESVVMDWLKTLKPRDVLIIMLVMMYGSKTLTVINEKPRIKKGQKKPVQKTDEQGNRERAEKEGATRGRGRPRKVAV